MKKLTFILGAVIVIALSSCSKEKNCTCSTTITGANSVGIVAPADSKVTIKDGECSDSNTSSTVGTITTKVTCTED